MMKTLRLVEHGLAIAWKHTGVLNITWYFFLSDQVDEGNIMVDYLSMEDITVDFLRKLLQGDIFKKFWSRIIGMKKRN